MPQQIIEILSDVLELGDRANQMDESTPLLGSMPEFDSMAVIGVITALEESYGFTVADDEIDAETFETVGSVLRFVESKQAS